MIAMRFAAARLVLRVAVAIVLTLVPALAGQALAQAPAAGPRATFNQHIIEALAAPLDVNDVDAVFAHVFAQLAPEVRVYPTENYYYFIFFAGGRHFWGNLRLAPRDRDRGLLHFAYFEYNDDPKHPDDFFTKYKPFGPGEGVTVTRRDERTYVVGYKQKSVTFHLNHLEQAPPRAFKFRRDEIFVMRTWDESGFQFFLLFDQARGHFLWVLNEEQGVPAVLEPVNDEIGLDRRSEFAFYLDRAQGRKILIGVHERNVRRNNYYDGPFDQLADNYVTGDTLSRYIQEAYPYTRGRIDRYGAFTDVTGSRVAITPYMTYASPADLGRLVERCKAGQPAMFYACLAYDYKTSIPAAPRRSEPATPAK